MILTVHQLQQYTEELAAKAPVIRDEVRLTSGGIDNQQLIALPFALPGSYASQATTLNLYGVAIGFFALWPTFDRKSNLTEALIRANSDDSEVIRRIRAQGMLVVGREEANWICVDYDGVVWRVDTMTSPTPALTEIAPSYEAFLLLAGNMHELSERHEGHPVACATEMRECCRRLGCSPTHIEFWETMARVMAS
jgi:hypothetical protein